MQKNLVIVESPAKAKTIEKFLGDDYKVMSSYGHIRDLKKHDLSINEQTLEPEYEIPDEKKKLVGELKSQAMRTAREKPSRGTCARCWAWMRRRPSALCSTRSPSRLSWKPSSIRARWT